MKGKSHVARRQVGPAVAIGGRVSVPLSLSLSPLSPAPQKTTPSRTGQRQSGLFYIDLMAAETMEMNGRVNEESSAAGEAPWGPGRWRGRGAPLNMNSYANKKSAAESMLDVALLMANASQLKAVLEQGPDFYFYTPLISLICISLILQVLVGILLIFIVKWNLNDESKHYQLNFLENISTALVFIIVVVNVFITAFGVQRPNASA
ncbi:ninjurin-1 [Denticeps clupeoides]|uniref:Ninjurin 1 n=1 Tax=Denticeps clupeoides TaxID=299321 RepID=A0AAY4A731_9TELE|nr:ninjurin-1-like [Denticeps clupeoides]